jgi:hypothetical protein
MASLPVACYLQFVAGFPFAPAFRWVKISPKTTMNIPIIFEGEKISPNRKKEVMAVKTGIKLVKTVQRDIPYLLTLIE